MTSDAEVAGPFVRPVVERCRSLGLRVERPVVLKAGVNVVVRLDPSPVVARVATLTAEMRGDAARYLIQEREVAAALALRGRAGIAPTGLIDPGPHVVDGLAFLLLERHELAPVDLDSHEHARLAARALVETLDVLATLQPADNGPPPGQPWDEISTLVQAVTPNTDRADLARVTEVVETLKRTEPDDPWQLVHGDAHRVNVAFSRDRLIWFDFEDCNQRSMAWDLATLVRSWPAAGHEACRLLGVDVLSNTMRWHHELREVYALLWALLSTQRHRRQTVATAERLSEWLGRHPSNRHEGS